MTNEQLPVPPANERGFPVRVGQIAFGRPEQRFALVAFLLGFLFWRWLMIVMGFGFQGAGVTVFAALYVAAVSLYFRHAGLKQNGEAKLWLGVVLATALSFAVWSAPSISPWRFIFLFGAATYWVVVAGGNTIKGATSDWSVRDFLGGVLVVPLGGLGLQCLALLSMNRPRVKVGSNVWPTMVGLALGLVVVALVLPLLVAADAGGFGEIGRWLAQFDFGLHLPAFVWVQLVLSLPTSAYIFALVVGNVRRGLARTRATTSPEDEPATGYRFMPGATAVALLGVVSALYLVFILTQVPYFFSAFGGRLPEGWVSYAEFARQGFSELCVIAVINLAVILGVHFSVEKGENLGRALKSLLSLLPLLTLVLIGTALSKLWLYIDQFGLTMMRVKPAAVLFLLAVIFASLALAERAKFPKLRVAVATGVIIMLAFSWFNVEGMVATYNANRYLAGTLPHFDVHMLRDLDVAGVSVAVRLINSTQNIGLAAELRSFVQQVSERDARIFAEQEEGLGWGMWVETWQRRQARALARGVRSHVTLEEVVAWVNRQTAPVTHLPTWALTIGEDVLMVEEVNFPFAVLSGWQGDGRQATNRVWIVDLRDGQILLGDLDLSAALDAQLKHIMPDEDEWARNAALAATERDVFLVARLFGLSPDGRKLGVTLARPDSASRAGFSLVGFVDLTEATPSLTGTAHATHFPLAQPRWSPSGRFIYYGGQQPTHSPDFTFEPEGTWLGDLSIACTVSRRRVAHVKSEDLAARLFPAAAAATIDFSPWITDITWAVDESTVEFITVAQPSVDARHYQQAYELQRVRQTFGEARWRINADGSDLRLLSVVRPE